MAVTDSTGHNERSQTSELSHSHVHAHLHAEVRSLSKQPHRETDVHSAHGNKSFIEIPPLHMKVSEKTPSHPTGNLTVHQLVEAHFLKAPSGHENHTDNSHKVDNSVAHRTKPVQAIRIVYNNDSNKDGHKSTAAFHITQHGAIQLLSNPDKRNDATLVITVDRPAGHLGAPSAAEQHSLTSLVGYLSEHFATRDQANKIHRPLVDDQMAVLSGSEKTHLNVLPRPEEKLPTHTRDAIARIHRFDGAGRGHLSEHQLESYFPGGSPSGDGETRAYKDVIAGMANVPREHSYTAVGTAGEGKVGVGRYQLSSDLLHTWLTANPLKAQELESNPKFMELLHELENNQRPQASLVAQALPEALQEQITSELINSWAPKLRERDNNIDAAKLALAFYLGHIPTAADEMDSANKSFLTAAKRLTSLSVAKTLYPGQGFDYQESNNSGCSTLALKLAAAAQEQAQGSHAHGSCSKYVRLAFRSVDPSLNRLFSRYAKDDHLGDDARFREICNSVEGLSSINLKPGDTIIYGPKVGTNSAGHIETMGLDHQMHSDFSHKLTAHFASEYKWLKVYRPVASA